MLILHQTLAQTLQLFLGLLMSLSCGSHLELEGIKSLLVVEIHHLLLSEIFYKILFIEKYNCLFVCQQKWQRGGLEHLHSTADAKVKAQCAYVLARHRYRAMSMDLHSCLWFSPPETWRIVSMWPSCGTWQWVQTKKQTHCHPESSDSTFIAYFWWRDCLLASSDCVRLPLPTFPN